VLNDGRHRESIPEGVLLHYVAIYHVTNRPKSEAQDLLMHMSLPHRDFDELLEKRNRARLEWEQKSKKE
jgi:hypothetical protein